MRQIRENKYGQKYELNPAWDSWDSIYFCRCCALKMYSSNKGFDYRCADCHEKAKGWC